MERVVPCSFPNSWPGIEGYEDAHPGVKPGTAKGTAGGGVAYPGGWSGLRWGARSLGGPGCYAIEGLALTSP